MNDRGDKQFITDYGTGWEKVSVIRDSRNYDIAIEKIKRQYNATEVIRDCVIAARLGWRYMTEEQRIRMVQAVKAANTGKPRSDEVKARISATMKGRPSNSKGHVKSETSKRMVALARIGKDPIKGKKWAHCPVYGSEKRLYEGELPEGWKWGRTPELKDWLKRY
jgi:hypothetical protein